jgi:hypothetical protein
MNKPPNTIVAWSQDGRATVRVPLGYRLIAGPTLRQQQHGRAGAIARWRNVKAKAAEIKNAAPA